MRCAVLSILLACGSSYEPRPEQAPPPKDAAAVAKPEVAEHPAMKLLRDKTFADVLVIGPGLWANLMLTERRVKRDALGKLGTESKVVVPGEEALVLESRTFGDAAARDALLATETFKALLTTFASATVRAATEAERKRLYAMVPFETEKGVVVFELGKRSLVLVIEKDKIFWIDSFDGYCTNGTLCPR